MIDSHCHLNFIKNSGSVDELVAAAANAGVHTIVNIGTDLDSSRESVELASRFAGVYATVGVHPHDARTLTDSSFSELKELANRNKVVAIGEIGLDYYRDLSPREMQKKAFVRQLGFAVEKQLPVVIHTRDSFEDTINIVKEYAPNLNGGIFHCFQGDMRDAERVFALGFHISVNGIITYKNSGMSRLAAEAPLEKMLLETDSPYLTPVPFRGKPNRPELVAFVYEKLAEIRSVRRAEIEKIVDRTCRKLYGLVETFGD
jgi:TatD DNase family protein